MLDAILSNLPTLLTAFVALGFIWKYGNRALKLMKEVKDLLEVVIIALEDKKITQEEIDAIINEAKDIPPAVKALFQK